MSRKSISARRDSRRVSGEEGTRKIIRPNTDSLDKDYAGIYNKALREKVPNYAKAESEVEYKNDNNARIILGRDRVGGIGTGYGGKGHTRSGAIDIVVGLQGWSPGENYREAQYDRNGNLKQTESFGFADKNFGSMNNGQPGDAARIYISQRADIDKYFDIANGSVGSSIADSAIAMKADSVRILARKGIKLVTGKNPPGRNSLDGQIKVTYGIDLIAGNRDDTTGLEQKLSKLNPFAFRPSYLQPIPKGENLIHYLDEITQNILLLNSITAGLLMITPLLSSAVLSPKVGVGPTGPITSFPGVTDIGSVGNYMALLSKQMSKLISQQKTTTAKRINFLELGGKHYINSKYNRTN